MVGIGCAQHVVGTSALQSHAIFAHVENLIAECTTEEGAQVPVLIAERIAPRQEMLGGTIANLAFVRRVGLCCRHLVAIVVVDQQKSVLVDACMFVSIELAYLATLFHAEEVFARTGARFSVEVEICHLVDIARQFGEFRITHAPVDACGPFQGTLGKHIVFQRHFNTRVFRCSHIHENIVVDKRWLRGSVVVEQVLRTTVEILHTTTQTTVYSHEVDTYVEGCRLLPSQVRIGIERRSITIDPLIVHVVGTIAAICRQRAISIEVGTARDTV